MVIVDDLKRVHAEMLEAIDGLSPDELTRQNTIGKWSARDVVLHMAVWEGEALKALAIWRTGHEYEWSFAKDYLKINDFWQEMLRHLTVDQAVRMFNLSHAALIADISVVSDDIWDKRGGVPPWLTGIAIGHVEHHLSKLQEYKKSLCK